jgi:prevent-host-death family protein
MRNYITGFGKSNSFVMPLHSFALTFCTHICTVKSTGLGGHTMLKEMKNYSMSEARNELTAMPERLEKRQSAVAITRRGKPVLAVMPWDLYESIMETLEILGDEEMTAALHKGIEEIAAGKGVAWEKAKRELAA